MADKAAQLREAVLGFTKNVKIHEKEIDGTTFYFKEMDTKTADTFLPLAQAVDRGEVVDGGFRARLLRMTMCDPDGMLIWTDAQVDQLGKIPSDVGNKLFEAALEAANLTDGDKAAKN